MPGKLKRNQKVIACDFDGTLTEDGFPSIGKAKESIIKDLLKEQENGAKIILWTCRDGKYLKEAVKWCLDHGIKFDAINDDLPEIKDSKFGKSKSQKVYATEYWDDKSVEIKESVTEMLKLFKI